MDILEIEKHKYYNTITFRLELPKDVLEELPIKQINTKDFIELLKNADYNPICYYNKRIDIAENEMGHDVNFRYVLKKYNKSYVLKECNR